MLTATRQIAALEYDLSLHYCSASLSDHVLKRNVYFPFGLI